MDASHPEPQSAGPDARVTSAGTAALVALAVLAFGTAATVMGPVLQPLLVAVFLFHATQFGAKSFARLGMQPWTAYAALIGLTLIASILTAQFVFREADIFRKSWPRYEDRIAMYVSTRWPAFTAESQPAPVTTQPIFDTTPRSGHARPSLGPPAPRPPIGSGSPPRMCWTTSSRTASTSWSSL